MNPVQILVGDCREKMKGLPENSVHCVVTSPPYWGLRDYGVEGQIGLEKSLKEFYAVMEDVFKEVWRVLRWDGTLWVNMGDTYLDGELLGVPWGLVNAIRDIRFCPRCNHPDPGLDVSSTDPGLMTSRCLSCNYEGSWRKDYRHWRLRSDIIWHKPNPVPEPDRGRPTVAHEYIFLLTKQRQYFYDTDAIREPVADETYRWQRTQRTEQTKVANGAPGQKPHSMHKPRSRSDGWPRTDYLELQGSNQGADDDRLGKGYQKQSPAATHPGGRNARTVWTIATKGYPGAHFATYPPELPERCIKAGTSEHGCCANCGAPYKRMTEVTEAYKEKLGQSWHDHQDDQAVGQRGIPSAFRGGPSKITTGWEPTCPCKAKTIPCTVLDPFNGAGTTGLVARRLMRQYIGIELNPDYAALAMARIQGDMPLLNQVSLIEG